MTQTPIADGEQGRSGVTNRSWATRGEVAERLKATVLKTVDRKVRGFESLPLRQN